MLEQFFDTLGQATLLAGSYQGLFWMFTGTLAGIIIGAIPGIGSALGTALALPFTAYMEPLSALLFIVALYNGAMYGGSISSILLNTPGDGAAAASTLEGYPMARKGGAVTALTISSTSSAIGGLVGVFIAMFGSAFMLAFLMLFGSPEYFLLGVFGVLIIALVSKGAFYKAIISALLGLAVTLIGIAPTGSADVRYAFNSMDLYNGISFLPVLLGLFGVATMATLFSEPSGQVATLSTGGGSRVQGIWLTLRNWVTLVKSSLIGFVIGAIPGTGGTVASFVSYAEAVRMGRKDPIPFGEGNPRGLVATESSNNACVGGALMPTLLFGIPGSATTAIVLAAMLLHGLRPGSDMFRGAGYVTTLALFVGLAFSGVIVAVIGLSSVRLLGKLTVVSKHIIIPIVIMVSVVGIYSVNLNWFDVGVMVGAGVIGYLMTKFGFPIIPAVVGVILGRIIEENLVRTLQLGDGSLRLLWTQPLSLVLLLMTILAVIWPTISYLRKRWH